MDSGGNRGQSAVLAFVLMVGIVAAGSAAVLLYGGSATEESRDQLETERIEKAFLELDNRIESVSRSEEGESVVDMDLPDRSEGAVREDDAGRMVIRRVNVTTGREEELVNQSLGAIVYQEGRTHVAYQAGGVWRGTGNESRMVSAPSISYTLTPGGDEPTLNVPLPAATGSERLTSGEVRITKDETISPVNDVTIVEGDLVTVEIQSEYYVAWADYFETITNSSEVELDHPNDTAIIDLVVPVTSPSVEAGIIVGAPGTRLEIGQHSSVDSYNSSNGSYSDSRGEDTRVIAAGEVRMKQNATIHGSLEVEGDLTMKQYATITENLRNNSSAGYTVDHDASIVGWEAPNASVSGRPAMDGVIDRNVALIRENNDNDTAANVSDGTLDHCAVPGACRLTAGSYYLEEIDLGDSEILILDTTQGPVNLAVLGEITLQSDAQIEVVGTGRVNLYLDSVTGSGGDFEMQDTSWVDVPDNRAPQFWLYLDSDAQAKFHQSAIFNGVVYGPGGGDPGTEIKWQTNDQVHIYGAVVGNPDKVSQNVSIHYDEALADATAVRTAIAVPRVTFLHASVHKVEVEDE